MALTYLKTTKHAAWSEKQMKTEIAAVRDSMKFSTGARAYAIPKDTLHRRIKGKLKFPVEEQHRNILN